MRSIEVEDNKAQVRLMINDDGTFQAIALDYYNEERAIEYYFGIHGRTHHVHISTGVVYASWQYIVDEHGNVGNATTVADNVNEYRVYKEGEDAPDVRTISRGNGVSFQPGHFSIDDISIGFTGSDNFVRTPGVSFVYQDGEMSLKVGDEQVAL